MDDEKAEAKKVPLQPISDPFSGVHMYMYIYKWYIYISYYIIYACLCRWKEERQVDRQQADRSMDRRIG